MTLQKLIENAKRKNCSINSEDNKFVGVCFNRKHVYHWFKIEDNTVWFDHSYSMNTGVVKKGLSHGMRIKDSLGFYN